MSEGANYEWCQKIHQYKINDPFLRLVAEKYESEIPWESSVSDENTLNSYVLDTMLLELKKRVTYNDEVNIPEKSFFVSWVDINPHTQIEQMQYASDEVLEANCWLSDIHTYGDDEYDDNWDRCTFEEWEKECLEMAAFKLQFVLNRYKSDAYLKWMDFMRESYPENPAFQLFVLHTQFENSLKKKLEPIAPPKAQIIKWMYRQIRSEKFTSIDYIDREYQLLEQNGLPIKDPFLRMVVEKYDNEIPEEINFCDNQSFNSYISDTLLTELRTRITYNGEAIMPKESFFVSYIDLDPVDLLDKLDYLSQNERWDVANSINDINLYWDEENGYSEEFEQEEFEQSFLDEAAIKLQPMINRYRAEAFLSWIDKMAEWYPEKPAFQLLMLRSVFENSLQDKTQLVEPPEANLIKWIYQQIRLEDNLSTTYIDLEYPKLLKNGLPLESKWSNNYYKTELQSKSIRTLIREFYLPDNLEDYVVFLVELVLDSSQRVERDNYLTDKYLKEIEDFYEVALFFNNIEEIDPNLPEMGQGGNLLNALCRRVVISELRGLEFWGAHEELFDYIYGTGYVVDPPTDWINGKLEYGQLMNVLEDYHQFIDTFKVAYQTENYSIQWCQNKEVVPSETFDRMDSFILEALHHSKTYFVTSNLRVFQHFVGHAGKKIKHFFSAEIIFSIDDMDGSRIGTHSFQGITGRKIEDESRYEEITISGCSSNALQIGNSYLEHLFIVGFLEEL
jgi:hypothetical protein